MDTMCHAQGHNTLTPVRLEPTAHRSWVKHSTTESLCSLSHQHAFIWCSIMQHNNFVLILTSINIFVVVVDSLFLVALDVCGGFVLSPLFCNAVLSVHSSFAITLLRKRELVAYSKPCLKRPLKNRQTGDLTDNW